MLVHNPFRLNNSLKIGCGMAGSFGHEKDTLYPNIL